MSRMLVAGVVVAVKLYEDHFYNNAYYSRIAGIPCLELNQLEVELLSLLEYDLTVTSEQYDKYMRSVHNIVAMHFPRLALPARHLPRLAEFPAAPAFQAHVLQEDN